MNRRSFLKKAGLLSAGMLLPIGIIDEFIKSEPFIPGPQGDTDWDYVCRYFQSGLNQCLRQYGIKTVKVRFVYEIEYQVYTIRGFSLKDRDTKCFVFMVSESGMSDIMWRRNCLMDAAERIRWSFK